MEKVAEIFVTNKNDENGKKEFKLLILFLSSDIAAPPK